MQWVALISFVLGLGGVLGWVCCKAAGLACSGERGGRPGDPAPAGWLCRCGTWNEEDIHCIGCHAEPPWGCDCDVCDGAPAAHGHRVHWYTRRRGEMRR